MSDQEVRELCQLRPGDPGAELLEDLLLLHQAEESRRKIDAAGGNDDGTWNYRETVRRDAFERWPIAIRRALHAEERLAKLAQRVLELSGLSGQLAAAEDRATLAEAAAARAVEIIERPPPGTSVTCDGRGNIIKINFPSRDV